MVEQLHIDSKTVMVDKITNYRNHFLCQSLKPLNKASTTTAAEWNLDPDLIFIALTA
jgi:hypothetical protein